MLRQLVLCVAVSAGGAIGQCDASVINLGGILISDAPNYALLEPYGRDAVYPVAPCNPTEVPDREWSTFKFSSWGSTGKRSPRLEFYATIENDLTCEPGVFGVVSFGHERWNLPLLLPGVFTGFAYSDAAVTIPMVELCRDKKMSQLYAIQDVPARKILPGLTVYLQMAIVGFDTHLPSAAYKVVFL